MYVFLQSAWKCYEIFWLGLLVEVDIKEIIHGGNKFVGNSFGRIAPNLTQISRTNSALHILILYI